MNEQLIAYAKDGLNKGYSEEQLRKIMLEHGVPGTTIDEVFLSLRGEEQKFKPLAEHKPMEQAQPQEYPQQMQPKFMQEKPHAKLFALLIVAAGLVLMIVIYLVRIFVFEPPKEELSSVLALLKGFWPLVFPIGANVANFFLYRKKFFLGLIITVLVLVALGATIFLLSALGA